MTKFERISLIRNSCELLGDKFTGCRAEQMMGAIAFQESNFEHIRQIKGPARGFWQFERGGGVVGVLNHPATAIYAANIVKKRGYKVNSVAIHAALETDDLLAGAFARLLLWTDPKPLPSRVDAGWDYYIRNWRPGKPHPERWESSWAQAKLLRNP